MPWSDIHWQATIASEHISVNPLIVGLMGGELFALPTFLAIAFALAQPSTAANWPWVGSAKCPLWL